MYKDLDWNTPAAQEIWGHSSDPGMEISDDTNEKIKRKLLSCIVQGISNGLMTFVIQIYLKKRSRCVERNGGSLLMMTLILHGWNEGIFGLMLAYVNWITAKAKTD